MKKISQREKVGVYQEGWSPLGSGKSLSVGRRLVPWEGSLPKGVDGTSRWGQGGFPEETLRLGIMMSLGLGVTLWGEENGGSLGSIGVAFPLREGGRGPRSSLFTRAGHDDHEEVGVPSRRHEARLKKKNGVRAFGPGAGLWGRQAR